MTYTEQKHNIIKQAVNDRKSITIIGSTSDKPIAFDNDKAFAEYRNRLTNKKQAILDHYHKRYKHSKALPEIEQR